MAYTRNYPITIMDNFFDEPDQFVKLAKTLSFKSDKEGLWPGTRTECLSTLFPELSNTIVTKILSLFHNFCFENLHWESTIKFQKVPFNYKGGWIHQDLSIDLTALVYFCNEGLGTSLYRVKDITNFPGNRFTDKKIESYKNISLLENYELYRNNNNKSYEETISVDSKFNRLFLFEGTNHHGVKSFIGNDKDDVSERLTMVIFIKNLIPMPTTRNESGLTPKVRTTFASQVRKACL